MQRPVAYTRENFFDYCIPIDSKFIWWTWLKTFDKFVPHLTADENQVNKISIKI